MDDPAAVLTERLSPLTFAAEEGFRELREALPLAARRRRRPRRRTVVVSGLVALLGLGAGGVAVATGGAHTGLFGLPGFTENDTSEYLDMRAPDFREVVLGYAQGVDFAPGYSAEMYLGLLDPAYREAQMPPELRGRGETMQVTGVRGYLESWAFCSWARTSTTDPGSLSHMRALASSPVSAATNAKDHNLRLVSQAEDGDPGPLRQYVSINCPQPRPWPAP
jgi:hypothetical protein